MTRAEAAEAEAECLEEARAAAQEVADRASRGMAAAEAAQLTIPDG
ncbi:hypothetical protein ACFXB4_00040 [Streptomyces lavendulae]